MQPTQTQQMRVESSQPTIEQVEKKPENWGRWEPLRLMGGGAAKACARDAVECFICLECCRCLCDCACDIICCPCECLGL